MNSRPPELSLSEQAYRRLRHLIVGLQFAPGDLLRENDLRERLELGRTPIREALQRLERDQFVTVVPRQGVFVAGIDVAELTMLYETRAVLEPFAARLAAARGTVTDWRAMTHALDDAEQGGLEPEGLPIATPTWPCLDWRLWLWRSSCPLRLGRRLERLPASWPLP